MNKPTIKNVTNVGLFNFGIEKWSKNRNVKIICHIDINNFNNLEISDTSKVLYE